MPEFDASGSMTKAEQEFLAYISFTYLEHDLIDEALTLLEAGVLLAPDDPVLWRNLAVGQLKAGRGSASLEAARRYVYLTGDDGDGSQMRLVESRALLLSGRDDEARELFNRFVDRRLADIELSGR